MGMPDLASSDLATTPALRPAVQVLPTTEIIQLPDNCQQPLVIGNIGDPGSMLSFQVSDTGPLAGFLDITNGSGVVPSGGSATVLVSVLSQFVDAQPSLVGDTLGLTVSTPGASNHTSTSVAVEIIDAQTTAEKLLGSWSGSWSGSSQGPGGGSAPVSGTWSLDLQTVDVGGATATGTLTWDGMDAYWDLGAAQTFVPDRTLDFGAGNTTFDPPAPPACGSFQGFHLVVDGTAGAANPSDAFYGPEINLDLDPNSGLATSMGTGFNAHPYNPANSQTGMSSGTLMGMKN
jgi:hypothetical protein